MDLIFPFQLQESLCTLNFIDLVIKVVTLVLTYYIGVMAWGKVEAMPHWAPRVCFKWKQGMMTECDSDKQQQFVRCARSKRMWICRRDVRPTLESVGNGHVSGLIVWTGISASVIFSQSLSLAGSDLLICIYIGSNGHLDSPLIQGKTQSKQSYFWGEWVLVYIII